MFERPELIQGLSHGRSQNGDAVSENGGESK